MTPGMGAGQSLEPVQKANMSSFVDSDMIAVGARAIKE